MVAVPPPPCASGSSAGAASAAVEACNKVGHCLGNGDDAEKVLGRLRTDRVRTAAGANESTVVAAATRQINKVRKLNFIVLKPFG